MASSALTKLLFRRSQVPLPNVTASNLVNCCDLQNLLCRHGFVVVRGFLDRHQQDALLEETDRVQHSEKVLHHWELTSNNDKVLCRSEKLVENFGMFNSILRGPVQQLVSQATQNAVLLYKEKINYKHPGGTGGFRPHQDITAYPFIQSTVTTCLLPLTRTTIENGCLWFADFSDKEVLEHKDGVIQDAANLSWRPCETELGDVILFDSFVPHFSEANTTSAARPAVYATYNFASEGDLRDAYYAEKARTMKTGEISLINHFQGSVVQEDQSNNASMVAQRLSDLFVGAAGKSFYDPGLTQTQHAIQVARLARQAGSSESLELACYLHDVGHLLLDEHAGDNSFLQEDLEHEAVGAKFLEQQGFNADIVAPIRLHVAAKRYLCASQEGYWAGLSENSQRSLQLQGGPMTSAEMEAFRDNAGWQEAVQMRSLEDESKRKRDWDFCESTEVRRMEELVLKHLPIATA